MWLLLACAAPGDTRSSLPGDTAGETAAESGEAGDDTGGDSPPLDDTGSSGESGADSTTDPGATCGALGGDTCVAADATACDGLPLLAASDCALCCDRSVYPAPEPAAFHIIDGEDTYSWDSALALVTAADGPLICAQNPPPGVEPYRWAQKVNATWYSSGEALADAIHTALVPVDGHPRMVMVDELRSDTLDLVDVAAVRMATVYPQWRGHWGVFLVNGESVHYATLQPAIDDLLDAGAAISVELYPAQSTYCGAGSSAAARDAWLAEFYGGSSDLARFDWLRARRDGRGSDSDLSVLFGVIDAYMDGTNPAWFLDRMFYVWVTGTEHADLFTASRGGVGPGAYKWDDPSMSNTSRDLAFYESYQHYVVAGEGASREGEVVCE